MKDIFYIELDYDTPVKGDTLFYTYNGNKIIVTNNPYKVWYKLLWEYLSFRRYKAPTKYKCELYKKVK